MKKHIISLGLITMLFVGLFPIHVSADEEAGSRLESFEERWAKEDEEAEKKLKEYAPAFFNSTMGGEVIGNAIEQGCNGVDWALKCATKGVRNDLAKYEGQLAKLNDQYARVSQRMAATKNMNYLNKFGVVRDRLDKEITGMTKMAEGSRKLSGIAKTGGKFLRFGLTKGFSAYGLYVDGRDYMNVKHVDHASLDMVTRTLRGMTMLCNTGDFFGAKICVLPAFACGVAKDIVESDYMVELSNREDVADFLGPWDVLTEELNQSSFELEEILLGFWYEDDTSDVWRRLGEEVNLRAEVMCDQADDTFREWGNALYEFLTGDRCNVKNAGVYKPNIYIYPTETTPVTVNFRYPGGLTKTIPDYSGSWSVVAEPDGKLHDGENEWDFLFYECITDVSGLQLEEGYVITDENRYEQLSRLIASYGFNQQETKDFADFWDEKLEKGISYAAYPLLTEVVDDLMPVEIAPAPDRIGRLWFAFREEDVPEREAQPEAFERDGYAVVEWGGLFVR